MFPDFSTRTATAEWMDDPTMPAKQLADSTDAIERVSRATGAMRLSCVGLDRVIDGRPGSVSILDVGTGNGAIAREFVAWGRRRGIDVEVVGIDLLEAAVGQARRQSAGIDGVRFRRQDLFDIADHERFDVVHASLVLHHFRAGDAARAIGKMAALSRRGVVVNDLHRHPVHWVGSKILVPLITRDQVARHDGPLSVLRGFNYREMVDLADASDFRDIRLDWRFPFRWLLQGRS